jgi:hypothetical protein
MLPFQKKSKQSKKRRAAQESALDSLSSPIQFTPPVDMDEQRTLTQHIDDTQLPAITKVAALATDTERELADFYTELKETRNEDLATQNKKYRNNITRLLTIVRTLTREVNMLKSNMETLKAINEIEVNNMVEYSRNVSQNDPELVAQYEPGALALFPTELC